MCDDKPDYIGPGGKKLRAEAQKFAEERNELFTAATKAFQCGDKAIAKELSNKGKEAGRQMIAANKRAAAAILKHRNDGHGDHYLDLHGLYLKEALTAFLEKLNELISSSCCEDIVFEVITGAGHHSKNKAVIKPKIIEAIQKYKLEFEEKNAGSILIFIIPPQYRTTAKTKEGSIFKDPTKAGAKTAVEDGAKAKVQAWTNNPPGALTGISQGIRKADNSEVVLEKVETRSPSRFACCVIM